MMAAESSIERSVNSGVIVRRREAQDQEGEEADQRGRHRGHRGEARRSERLQEIEHPLHRKPLDRPALIPTRRTRPSDPASFAGFMVSIWLTGRESGANGEWGVANGTQIANQFRFARSASLRVASHKKEGRRKGDLPALPMATQDQGAAGQIWGGMGGIRPDVTPTRRSPIGVPAHCPLFFAKIVVPPDTPNDNAGAGAGVGQPWEARPYCRYCWMRVVRRPARP